ncbi:reverse transcriptase [Corchorus capsularis]|uniref:Reverse transcriptase n=1 Tax=Corchorus capsularis TaxID=210143 RepID=A0A1R3JN97_COCAP|nr:reverse transcriptase [Corchorus capsularis]
MGFPRSIISAETSGAFSSTITAKLGFDQNTKVVDLEVSFPTPTHLPHLEFWIKSYGQNTEGSPNLETSEGASRMECGSTYDYGSGLHIGKKIKLRADVNEAISYWGPGEEYFNMMNETIEGAPFVVGAGEGASHQGIRKFKRLGHNLIRLSSDVKVPHTDPNEGRKRSRDGFIAAAARQIGEDYISLGADQYEAGGDGLNGYNGAVQGRYFSDQSEMPWLCSGDFNEILSNEDKIGGAIRPQRQMDAFREVLDNLQLKELPIKGPRLTWSRKLGGEIQFAKLDHCFIIDRWLDKFVFSYVDHLCTSVSDHLPLLIHCLDRPNISNSFCKRFRFEDIWALHENFNSVLCSARNMNVNLDIKNCISNCSEVLSSWDQRVFGSVKYNIRQKRKELDRLYREVQYGANPQSLHECMDSLNELYDKEEVMWRQRAKISWLRESDRNSKTFHNAATVRRIQNYIGSIKDENGDNVEDAAGIERVICDYFKAIFTSSNPPNFDPSRGIRQGDPLSPYLFLFCMEGFSSLIQHTERSKVVQGVSIVRASPRVSHLLFADDSLLFLRASLEECEALLDILTKFEKASGQKINIDKSAVLFSSNTPDCILDSIMRRIGVQKILARDKYLGAPIMIGRNKKIELQMLKDRLWKRIQGWQGRLFSITGKVVMIQVVAQAIPTYLMSCFKFPKTFVQELNSIIAKFWWGSTDSRRRIHWKTWASLCVSKLDGGLGFRDFEAFNLALLAKQCLRLIRDENSLCSRIFKGKYYQGSSFMRATLGSNPSFVWRSLLAGREVLRSGCHWKIEDGQSVDIWRDKWLNSPPEFRPQPRPGTICVSNPVSTLFNENGQWEIDLSALSAIKCGRYLVQGCWPVCQHGEMKMIFGQHVYRRNKAFHDKVVAVPTSIARSVARLVLEVEQSNVRSRQLSDRVISSQGWTPPYAGSFKVNTDASFDSFRLEAGLGAVVWNEHGQVVVCSTAQISKVPNVLFAEIYAIRFGLLLAYWHGIMDCSLESDSVLAISEINKREPSLWIGGGGF